MGTLADCGVVFRKAQPRHHFGALHASLQETGRRPTDSLLAFYLLEIAAVAASLARGPVPRRFATQHIGSAVELLGGLGNDLSVCEDLRLVAA